MTVEECAERITNLILQPVLSKDGPPKGTGTKVADAIVAALRALIYGESERAAAMATENYFEFLADEIIRTSPGKPREPR